VIAISASVKEHLIKDFKVDEKNIAVIHNGIDVSKFTVQSSPADAGSRLRLNDGREEFRVEAKINLGLGQGPVVGIVARLSDVKGHIYLIQAMKSVLKNIPDAQLLIVGDGNLRQELVNLTAHLEMEKNVFFKPSVLDTREVLSIMDVFVMPSLKEGLGLALMEAMARGLAVIGSDIGGIRSLIKDGANGLLVRPADVAGLTWAILELLQNPDRANSLGDAAQKFINENFTQEKMIRETEEVYLECVAAKE
jgi:glycosyltransferase involved in cell wall biosynthesis